MSDVACLKAMLNHDSFVKFSPILFKLKNMEKETSMILKAIRGYYIKYKDKKKISIDELKTFFHLVNPSVDKPDNYAKAFSEIELASYENAELLLDVLRRNVEKHLCTKISQVAEEVVQDIRSSGIENIEELCKEYRNIAGAIQDVENDVCNLTLAELLQKDSSTGLKWRLGFLNKTFGPLKQSTLGHIFARPNAGKTSMSLDQGVYFSLQSIPMNRPVLYLNNEERIDRIRMRAYAANLKKDAVWLMENQIEAEKMWKSRGGDNFKFIGEVYHIDQIKKYLDVFYPRVVFIDQGPKVEIWGSLDGVARLQKLYNTYRQLAVEYETSIITLGQADERVENKKWLHLNHIDGSKTAVPGELDWVLGIGMLNDISMEGVRFLRVCKNKLSGIYGQEEVKFTSSINRFEDLS